MTLRALAAHHWPGNIRELRHSVHRAIALSDSELELQHLIPRTHRQQAIPAHVTPERTGQFESRHTPSLPIAHRRTLRAHERRETLTDDHAPHPLGPIDAAMRDMMLDAYERHGSIRGAAAALQIPKSTFADRARRLGIKTKR
jgi:transcriptional regulator of acetoin/glycerol metabolism